MTSFRNGTGNGSAETAAERRKREWKGVKDLLLGGWGHLSNRSIAQQVGTSDELVREVRKELGVTPPKHRGADGREQPASRGPGRATEPAPPPPAAAPEVDPWGEEGGALVALDRLRAAARQMRDGADEFMGRMRELKPVAELAELILAFWEDGHAQLRARDKP